MHVDPNSPHATLTKRQQEVLDRLGQGMGAREIARDIGVSRNAVYQHIERLRRSGAVARATRRAASLRAGSRSGRPLAAEPARKRSFTWIIPITVVRSSSQSG